MNLQAKLPTRAITAMEMPRVLAEAMGRPVVILRARRGGRRQFEKLVSPFGERAVQILDTDGYLLLVVKDAREQHHIITSALGTAEQVDITAWDDRGEAVAIEKGTYQ
ncbi:hypothetical protein [Sphingomonas sp. 3-13AW]|uniref:hypothetical protein n=1 Tax=Sphingomonas sp. 3-13AW TaxID=3050450 RepID=UPI003BB59F01